MFRISKAEEASRTVIRIDGQFTCGYTEVAETVCNEARLRRKETYLFRAIFQGPIKLGVHCFAGWQSKAYSSAGVYI